MYRFISKHSSDHYVFFLSRSLVTPRHGCIMNEAVNESLRKICNYQQNVSQHYYLLDNLVNLVIVVVIFSVSTFRPWSPFLESLGKFSGP